MPKDAYGREPGSPGYGQKPKRRTHKSDSNTRDWGEDAHKNALILNRNTRKMLEHVEGMEGEPMPYRTPAKKR